MNKSTPPLLTIVGLILSYAVAFGLGRTTVYLRQQSLTFGNASPLFFFAVWSLAKILLAVCVLSLYTWAMPNLAPWAVLGIVIVGLLIDLVPVIYWLPFGLPTAFLSPILSNRAYVISAGGWTAVAGRLTLVKRQSKA